MKFYIFVISLFISSTTFCQTIEELKTTALRDAKATSEATMNKDFNTILNHTHPNIYKNFGKKQLKGAMKDIFETMDEQNIKFTSSVVDEITEIKKENNEYHCLVKNTIKMDFNGKKLTMKSSLFGFYNKKADKWYFVESNKLLNDPETKQLFPDFKTEIEIPLDQQLFDQKDKPDGDLKPN